MELHTPSGRWRLGFCLSLVSTFMWGVLPIALKALLEHMDAFTITWFRLAFSGLLLGSYLALFGRLPALRGHTKATYLLLGLVVAGLAGNYVCFILGLARLSATAAQVLIQLAPLLATVGALCFFKERFSTVQWLGFFCVGIGMVLFFHKRFAEIFTPWGSYAVGVAFIVSAALTWAVYALSQKQLLSVFSSSSILLLVYCASACILLPMAAPAAVLHLRTSEIWLLLFCALNTLVAYGCLSEAMAHWEASRVNAVAALTPVITLLAERAGSILWPWRLGSESLSALSASGAFLVVAGSMSIALGHGGNRGRQGGRAVAGRE